jgi:hypothetical protein
MNLRPTNIEKGEGGEFSLFKLIGPIIMSLIVDYLNYLGYITYYYAYIIQIYNTEFCKE